MGVIHKLTEEVINYILEKKRENPKIGCRSLSDIVSEKFSRKISKSSISDVLKEHGLSGSIGRPAASEKPKRPAFSIPQERKKQLFGSSVQEPSSLTQPAPEIKQPKAEEPDASRPSLRADPVLIRPAEILNADDKSSPKVAQATAQPKDSFLDNIEILREKERQESGADLLSVGAIYIYAVAHHLGLITTMSNLLRQHISHELPAHLESICSALLILRFLGVENEEDVHASRAEVVWALSGRDIKDSCAAFWKNYSGIKLPMRFDLILKNELSQQAVHGGAVKIFPEEEAPIILDAQLSSLGPTDGAAAQPIARALDIISERIIANNRPLIIENVGSSDESHDQMRRLMSAFSRPDTHLKKVEITGVGGEVIVSFSQMPRKRRNFIIGISETDRLFSAVSHAVKWGSFTPIYSHRLDQVCRFLEFDSNVFSGELGLTDELAKTVVLAFDSDSEPKRALVSNMKGLSAQAIAEQFIDRWPFAGMIVRDKFTIPVDEINNTLNSRSIDSVLSAFDLVVEVILLYLARVSFKESGGEIDASSLQRMLYTINGKLLSKGGNLKAFINSYQPPKLNEALISASLDLTRHQIMDQNKREIVLLAGR